MNLFSAETKQPKPNNSEIQAGDSVFMDYGENEKAFGTCIEVDKELLVIDYTTELSTEPRQDKFIKGLWKK